MTRGHESGVLGLFAHMDAAIQAIAKLRQAGLGRMRVYSPVPRHEIVDAAKPGISPVRIFALVGGVSGTAAGFGLAVWTTLQMKTIISGKPILSWPPYFVIGFELTVLIGALATMVGFLILAALPRLRLRRGYDPKFSDDRFGIFVLCDPGRRDDAKQILQTAGAEEVRLEEA